MRLTDTERKKLHDDIVALLDEYDYYYEHTAIDKIIDEWEAKKGWLIDAFKKHPNYVDGKYLIAFDTDYEREIDNEIICQFKSWVKYHCLRKTEYASKLPAECRRVGCFIATQGMYKVLDDFDEIKTRTLNEGWADRINEHFPNIRAKEGEKTSRVINRLLTYLHYNEHPDYNREYAKYADALSPMTIKRHTVLSINPLDYLTMSFGNSWASCHTIDKQNRRMMPNDYSGCYSSGTVSYMLDAPSMVMYTVDKAYDGTDYFKQPKITRQMYHFGEEKLVQGRLYPQSCDGADNTYEMYRKIVQEIMATIFDVPNLWTVSHNVGNYVESEGTHYRDYTHFSSCNISILSGTHNTSGITIGAEPICIKCGGRHDCEENINCCRSGLVRCADCGARHDRDDMHMIDGEWYCDECCSWCECCEEYVRDDMTYVAGYGDVCERCRDCYDERMAEFEAERREAEEAADTENTDTKAVEWRVVNRAPQVGDYIRLVGKEWTWNRIGDILQVEHLYVGAISGEIVPGVSGRRHPRKTSNVAEMWGYWNARNYEVVERVTESEEA